MNGDVLLRMYQGFQKLRVQFPSSSHMLLTPFSAVVDDGILSSTNEGDKSENELRLIVKPTMVFTDSIPVRFYLSTGEPYYCRDYYC